MVRSALEKQDDKSGFEAENIKKKSDLPFRLITRFPFYEVNL